MFHTPYVAYLIGNLLFFGSSVAIACPDDCWDNPQTPDERYSEMDWMEGMPSMRRHHYVMKHGLPDEYRSLDNPLITNTKVLAEGMRTYQQNCTACHGEQGRGNGPAGDALRPRPANLQRLSHMSMMVNDAYLYWTIAEGGKPIDTDMPTFKEGLSTEEIWSVVLYLRKDL